MLSCTEMRNVSTCISYSVSVVEILLAQLYRNDDNDVSDKHIIAHKILLEGDFFFSQQVSSELGNYILKQMMLL